MQISCSPQTQDDWREILSPLRTGERPTLVEFMDGVELPPHKQARNPTWKTSPTQVGLLLLLAYAGILEEYIAKPVQVGLSEAALGLMMWVTIYKGETWGYFMPTDKMASRLAQSVDHWVRTHPEVNKQFLYGDKPRKRGPGNTQEEKWFTKANQYYLGGNTIASTAQITLRGAILDEFARVTQDVKSEGSLLGAARGRQKGSKGGDVIRAFSNHTDPDSLLVKQMELCGDDLFECEIPCPRCDYYSVLHWGEKDDGWGITFDGEGTSIERGKSVRHVCRHCGEGWLQKELSDVERRCRWVSRSGLWMDSDTNQLKSLKEGAEPWIKGAPNLDDWVKAPSPKRVAIGHCPDGKGLYGMASWPDEVTTCIEAKSLEKNYGDTNDIQRFENEFRAIPFVREHADVILPDDFLERREQYQHRIPVEVQSLTCGVDFGSEDGGYVYWQVEGHGANGARWAIEKRKIYGDCQDENSRMYTQLDDLLSKEHERGDGVMLPIDFCLLDGRHIGDMVKKVAAKNPRQRIVVFGSNNYKAPLFDFDSKKCWKDEFKCYEVTINPSMASQKTYYKLSIPKEDNEGDLNPGFFRFPIDEEFNRAYAAELGADLPYQKQTPHGTVTAYKNKQSNEAHDVTKYNTIALIAGVSHGRIRIDNDYVPGKAQTIDVPEKKATGVKLSDLVSDFHNK